MRSLRTLVGFVRLVALRPRLWLTALRQARRFAPDGWWRRPLWLPLPDPALISWRAQTQYGDPAAQVQSRDMLAWLEWCRAEHRRSA